jgi:hypothetical protein
VLSMSPLVVGDPGEQLRSLGIVCAAAERTVDRLRVELLLAAPPSKRSIVAGSVLEARHRVQVLRSPAGRAAPRQPLSPPRASSREQLTRSHTRREEDRPCSVDMRMPPGFWSCSARSPRAVRGATRSSRRAALRTFNARPEERGADERGHSRSRSGRGSGHGGHVAEQGPPEGAARSRSGTRATTASWCGVCGAGEGWGWGRRRGGAAALVRRGMRYLGFESVIVIRYLWGRYMTSISADLNSPLRC